VKASEDGAFSTELIHGTSPIINFSVMFFNKIKNLPP
jgi:hypothetical protein